MPLVLLDFTIAVAVAVLQAMYQMLDEHFVGLIFSVFNKDTASLSNRVQVTAFQSVPLGSTTCNNSKTGNKANVAECQHDHRSTLVSVGSEDMKGVDTLTIYPELLNPKP